jgi:hypothetical protein
MGQYSGVSHIRAYACKGKYTYYDSSKIISANRYGHCSNCTHLSNSYRIFALQATASTVKEIRSRVKWTNGKYTTRHTTPVAGAFSGSSDIQRYQEAVCIDLHRHNFVTRQWISNTTFPYTGYGRKLVLYT